MAEASKGRGRGGGRGIRTRPGGDAPGGLASSGQDRGQFGGGDQGQPSGATASALSEQFTEGLTLLEAGDAKARELVSTTPKPQSMAKQAEATLEQAMKRPGVGTVGREIQLHANHFPLNIPPNMRLYHYDLSIGRRFVRKKGNAPPPTRKPPARRQRDDEDEEEDMNVDEVIGQEGDNETVIQRRNKWPRWIPMLVYDKLRTDASFGLADFAFKMAFDGRRNVFAQCKLPVSNERLFQMTIKSPDEDRSNEYVVQLKFISEIAVDLREVFNRNLVERKSISTLILDIILRQSKMFSNEFIAIGPRAFYHPQSPIPLGGGILHYPGIWESVRPVSGWKSTVNLDVANTAFVKEGPVLALVSEFVDRRFGNWQNRELSNNEIKQLEKLVKGLKVVLIQRSLPRTLRCNGVSKMSARELKFLCETTSGSPAPISVEKYFELQFQKNVFVKPLQYPLLPCLKVGNKDKANYVPLEFCRVKGGQRFNQKLSEQQTSAMLKAASSSAPDRKRKIEEEFKHFGLANDPYLRDFGLSVDTKMVSVKGRVLPPPTVEYGNNKFIKPQNGEWNMTNSQMIRGASIRNWGVINTDRNTQMQGPNSIENFCRGLMNEARNLGMRFLVADPILAGNEGNAENIENVMLQIKNKAIDPNTKENTLDLVFVILPSKNSIFYSSTKSAGDVVHGISTQCILGKNIQKASPALMVNLLLKINAKLGGINNRLVDASKEQINHLREPILIIGADVNHPAPTDSFTAQSVAAVVANVDPNFAQYLAKIMVQNRRQEPIAELQQAVQEMIYNFRNRNGVLPTRIIMYRDGVGESMFLKVLTDELHAIRQACVTMGKHFKDEEYQPPITFLVVQKRHHTRLFCANSRDETGRGKNIPPGTTVDTTIVHPEEFDFYLCSHIGLQGTSRPTHYHVLWDDSDFTADQLQLMTYYLCHTYARATKSVSIPPPCYYADLVAYRARQYLSWKCQGGSETASSGSGGSGISMTDMQRYVSVKENIASKGMFFV